jgi:putative flippase GtrA
VAVPAVEEPRVGAPGGLPGQPTVYASRRVPRKSGVVAFAHGVAPAMGVVVAWWIATTIGPSSDVGPDVALYRAYAQDVSGGLVPYRDFLFEYPPLALAPILLAGAAETGSVTFRTAFETLMLVALLVIQWQTARLAGRHRGPVAWSFVLLPLAAGAIIAERLDIFAMAFVVAGLAVLVAGREGPSPGRAAGALALLALGAATKLFPVVVAAVALAWLWGQGRRRAAVAGAAAFGACVLLVCLPFAVVAPGGFYEQFAFHSERPVQIESTPATLLRLTGGTVVTGVEEAPNDFRSQAVEGGASAAVAGAFAALQFAAILLAVLCAGAAGRFMGGAAALLLPAAAALIAFAVLGKVLSPQFVLWPAALAPLLWIVRARAAAVLVVVALLLTQLEYPHRYTSVVEGDPAGLALLTARNGILLLVLATLLVQAALLTVPGAEASTPSREMRPGRAGAVRARAALRRKANWIQLLRFGLVGASGYVVNLLVFALAVEGSGFNHRVGALVAFLAAVTNNFVWNRRWTFADRHGRVSAQAVRFLIVSTAGLCLNVVLLEILVSGLHVAEVPAQALAVAVVMPVNFVGNRLWTFATSAEPA